MSTIGVTVVVPWLLILVSFLVCMFKDIGIGLRILGYGVAEIWALAAVLAVGAVICTLIWWYVGGGLWAARRREMPRVDPRMRL